MKKEWKKKASFEYRIPNIFCIIQIIYWKQIQNFVTYPCFYHLHQQ